MNIKTHLLNANGQLAGLEETIETVLNQTLLKITAAMPIDNVDIVISDKHYNIIPNYGLGGIASSPNIAELFIDPKFPDIKEQIQRKFPHQIAHELHHCMRWQSIGKKITLLDALVRDGLADQFAMEVVGIGPEPWDSAVKGEELQVLLKRAEKEFDNPDYDHIKWFFSKGKGDIPHWTGYSLGFYLVGEYLKKYPQAKASILYNLPAEEFVK